MPGLEPTPTHAAAGAALAAGAGLSAVAFGLFHPRSSLFGPTVWRGPATRRAVALTFDDGPDPHYTARIAEILDAHDVRATFFCIGQQLHSCQALAKSLLGSGHELENHTYSHNTGRDLFSASRLVKDLRRCQDLLGGLSGKAPRYYRPAVGIRNPPVHSAARALGLTVVTWTHAARDGLLPLSPRRARALAQRADAGSILALHDGQRLRNPSLREHTVRQLPLLLALLQERGFALQTLSELLQT
jgi:peptidoglycan/xylan/chitin deacetylase (PgdA/CDA1 family)